MSKSQDSVGRRGFLQTAATGAAGIVAGATPGFGQARQDLNQQVTPSDLTLRVKAMESLLVDKGLVDRAALDQIVDAFETKIGPRNGARVVAHAWVDPAFKKRLLANAGAAIAELVLTRHQDEDLVVVENTPEVHNLV